MPSRRQRRTGSRIAPDPEDAQAEDSAVTTRSLAEPKRDRDKRVNSEAAYRHGRRSRPRPRSSAGSGEWGSPRQAEDFSFSTRTPRRGFRRPGRDTGAQFPEMEPGVRRQATWRLSYRLRAGGVGAYWRRSPRAPTRNRSHRLWPPVRAGSPSHGWRRSVVDLTMLPQHGRIVLAVFARRP